MAHRLSARPPQPVAATIAVYPGHGKPATPNPPPPAPRPALATLSSCRGRGVVGSGGGRSGALRVATKPTSSTPAAPPLPRVVILHGPERFRQLERTDEIKAELQALGSYDVLAFDGNSARIADILDECRSFGLIAQHKLIIIDNADMLLSEPDEDEGAAVPTPAPARRRGAEKSTREMLEAYAAAPEAMTTLVLRAETFKGPKLEKAVLAGGGRVVKCEQPRSADAAAWAVRRAKSHHAATLTGPGAQALIDALGPDLGRIDSELGKLAISAQARGAASIDPALVEEFSASTREEKLWSIQSALLSGDPERALAELNHLIEVLRENPVGVGLAYLDLARKLDGAARGLAARENPATISSRLRLWGDVSTGIMAVARAEGPAVTTELLAAAIETDARCKSGGGDPRRLLEVLTLRFTSLSR